MEVSRPEPPLTPESPADGAAAALPPAEGPAVFARLREKVQAFRERHERAERALFFICGFLFDVSVLDRIDHPGTLIQHGSYLVLLLGMVLLDQRQALVGDLPAWMTRRLQLVENAAHFLLGTLLNAFTFFYFKSASGLTAFLFLAILFALLTVNELPRFRAQGPVVRVALYSFCLTSYLAYLFPVLAGYLGRKLFVLAAGSSSLVLVGLYFVLGRWSREARERARRAVIPAAAMQALLVALFLLKLLPPVPLAVQFMGIYHGLERDGTAYRLLHQKPNWKIWHHGDQDFAARPGDRIYCFVRVFAPRHFKDRIRLHWSYDDPQSGWRTTDVIPLTVNGDLKGGFRGYAYKGHWQPGRYRVEVETDDGRDLGSLRLTVTPDDGTDEREFQADPG